MMMNLDADGGIMIYSYCFNFVSILTSIDVYVFFIIEVLFTAQAICSPRKDSITMTP